MMPRETWKQLAVLAWENVRLWTARARLYEAELQAEQPCPTCGGKNWLWKSDLATGRGEWRECPDCGSPPADEACKGHWSQAHADAALEVALGEYKTAMTEEVIPQIEADMKDRAISAHYARLGVPRPPVDEMPADSSARLPPGQVGGQGVMLRASPPTAPAGDAVERACRAMCKADGTAQCAAICLSYFASSTRGGHCPEAVSVWGRKARAALQASVCCENGNFGDGHECRKGCPPADDAGKRRARELSDGELALELKSVEQKWADFRDNIEDGHSGSPGEWLFERMDELQTEQDRRISPADDAVERLCQEFDCPSDVITPRARLNWLRGRLARAALQALPLDRAKIIEVLEPFGWAATSLDKDWPTCPDDAAMMRGTRAKHFRSARDLLRALKEQP